MKSVQSVRTSYMNKRANLEIHQPLKPIVVQENGLILEGVLVCLDVKKAANATPTQNVQAELKGALASGPDGKKLTSPPKSYVIIPTNVDALIQDWLNAEPEKRARLPYVPRFDRHIPTISMRLTSRMKDPNDKKKRVNNHFFILPWDHPRFMIEQYRAIIVGCFNGCTVPFGSSVAISSFIMDPSDLKIVQSSKRGMGPTGQEVIFPDSLDNITPQKDWEFKTHMPETGINYIVSGIYLSCESIRPLRSPIEDLPQEYKAEGLFFDPSFDPINLDELFKRYDTGCVESLDQWRRVYYWLRLDKTIKDRCQTKFEHVIRTPRSILSKPDETGVEEVIEYVPGDIVEDPEHANYAMHYMIQYDRRRPSSDELYPRTSPEVFIQPPDQKKKTASHQANGQLKFEQVVSMGAEQPKGEVGMMFIKLFEPKEDEQLPAFSINHSGIYNNWPALMSMTTIPVTVYANLSVSAANDRVENHNPRQRDDMPVGLFDMYCNYGVWHIIEYCRSFGIPVTGAWVNKLFDDKTRRDKFKPEKALAIPNIVNRDKGKTYGFINFSEYSDDDKKEYATNPDWHFCVLTDYDFNELQPDEQETLQKLTPEDGVLIMDGDRQAKLRIKGRNCSGGVIIGYRYDPRWEQMIEVYKRERINSLSNWRRLINDATVRPLLDDAALFYASASIQIDPFSKIVVPYSYSDAGDKMARENDRLPPGLVSIVGPGGYVVKEVKPSAMETNEADDQQEEGEADANTEGEGAETTHAEADEDEDVAEMRRVNAVTLAQTKKRKHEEIAPAEPTSPVRTQGLVLKKARVGVKSV